MIQTKSSRQRWKKMLAFQDSNQTTGFLDMMQKHRPIKEADELYCPNFISTAMIKYPDHMQLGRKRAYFCLQFQLQTKHRSEGGSRLRQPVTS